VIKIKLKSRFGSIRVYVDLPASVYEFMRLIISLKTKTRLNNYSKKL